MAISRDNLEYDHASLWVENGNDLMRVYDRLLLGEALRGWEEYKGQNMLVVREKRLLVKDTKWNLSQAQTHLSTS